MEAYRDEWAYVVEGKLELPYRYYPGRFWGHFLKTLRDREVILGIRCPKCNKVLVPPRPVCGTCFGRLDEWVELPPEGVITSFTRLHYKEPYHPRDEMILGLIRLDGADTAMCHLIGGADPGEIRVGARVRAVFVADRGARMTDIDYFKPI